MHPFVGCPIYFSIHATSGVTASVVWQLLQQKSDLLAYCTQFPCRSSPYFGAFSSKYYLFRVKRRKATRAKKKKKTGASRVSRTCSHRASLHRSRTLYSLDHRFRVFIHLKLQHKSRFIFSPAFRFAFVNSCLSRALTANLL